MKKKISILFSLIPFLLSAQIKYNKYFEKKTLRIDYIIAGNTNETNIFLKEIKQEPFWGGSLTNVIDTFNYGNYKVLVFDFTSKKLIYSRGFCTIFNEWQTTKEAKNSNSAFYNTSIIPFPKEKIEFKIQVRNKDGQFENKFEIVIDPNNYLIIKDKPIHFNTSKIIDSGDPSKCIDIVFIAEGYTEKEINKFIDDVKRISNSIIATPPFSNYKDKFNIWAVESISQESGPDIPLKNIFKNTITNFSFSVFNMDRYLASFDTKSIRDIAANVPYDQIFVIINSEEYGGGGFFNHYVSCTSNNILTEKVAIHEFGHGFAGLADEYYNSNVAYNDFYNLSIEPWEPNITTLVEFEKKWNSLINKNTPIPTPRDSYYINVVGVFEGGGYVTKGVFSPYMDCRMKSNITNNFCPVCQLAITKMLEFYTE